MRPAGSQDHRIEPADRFAIPSAAPTGLDRDGMMIPAIAEDGSLFPVGKMEVHRRGMLHQAVSVFVFSGDELLIQRRAATKYHCGLQWANTCCTHPHWGEDERSAATRRLREELGISVELELARVITYEADVTDGLVEHERVQVFWGIADKANLPMRLNSDEVQDISWADLDTLRAQIRRRPQDFTPWFQIYLARWTELGLQVQ